ncbi:MAG TPA: tetratricopeptide repeat protein, partial [Rhodothermales bacterium]|nr:tetratricopeptide repeat protein [Rhodothermales bacterium]
ASAPHSAEALLGKARVFNEQGQYEEAEAMYEQAIALRPDYWPGYRELALFYYLRGRYLDAVTQFEIVANLAPLNALGYTGMGSSYYNLGLLEQARHSWENALEISDDYPTNWNLGTLNFFLGDYSGAATALEKALSLDSTDYLAWSNLAMAYHHLPNQTSSFEKAAHNTIDLVRKLLDLNPKDDFARARLAGIHIMLGDTATAHTYLAPYTGDVPADLSGETIFEIATVWESLGHRDRAFTWLRAALERGYTHTELFRYPGLADLREDSRFLDLILKPRPARPAAIATAAP